VVGSIFAAGPAAGQIALPVQTGQTWTDVGVGIVATNASLRFEGRQYQALPPDMRFETALDLVPAASLHLRHWIDRSFGLRVSGSLGLLPSLVIPTELATRTDGSEATLQVTTRELQTALLYRLHFGPSPTAIALQLELGFDLLGYTVQETDPPILVSTTYVGPTANLGLHVPIGAAFAVGLSGGVLLPIYVLEDPVDSGRVDSSRAFTGELSLEYQLTRSLLLGLGARWVGLSTSYTDHGSRGVSGHGVYDGQADDTFLQAGLNVRYIL